LICSIITAVIGSSKEIIDLVKSVITQDKTEIAKLQSDITDLTTKFNEKDARQQRINSSLKQQINELRLINTFGAMLAKPTTIPVPLMTADILPETPEVTKSVSPEPVMLTMSAPNESSKFGWIIGLIGILAGAVFAILHYTHKDKPNP
jgi:hypothetical protein